MMLTAPAAASSARVQLQGLSTRSVRTLATRGPHPPRRLRSRPAARRSLRPSRAEPDSEVGQLLSQGKSRQEVLSSVAQSGVADVVDIDRSAELFMWIFQSVFGDSKGTGQQEEQGEEPAPGLGTHHSDGV